MSQATEHRRRADPVGRPALLPGQPHRQGASRSRSCSALAARQRAAAIRERIEATVVRRAPQVMVKVTGGGRGMKAIAAHFRYISKNGRLEIEDERGADDARQGRAARAGRRLALRRHA